MVSPSNSDAASPSSSGSGTSGSGDVYGPVPSGRRAAGRIRVPGSKSIAQRYLALALLANGEVAIHGAPDADDVRHFAGALRAAGLGLERDADGALRITPAPEPSAHRIVPIDCGAGGTMYRFLTAVLCAIPGRWRIDGTERLRERPVGPLAAALRQLGAKISFAGDEGYAPVEVRGGSLGAGHAVLDAGASSQYLSALLLASTAAEGRVMIEVAALTSEPYVDLTLDAIRVFGGTATREGSDRDMPEAHGRVAYSVEPGLVAPTRVEVEADLSAVAYPAAAAALTGGTVFVEAVNAESRQGDRAFLDLLQRMGATVTWRDGGVEIAGPEGGRLRAVDEDLSSVPDQVPTLAALAPFAAGETVIRNVPHLRLKESDRLRAMTRELRRVGAAVEELEDGLVIEGVWADETPPAIPVTVGTWEDHRIAMAMALVGLRRPGLSLRDPGVVRKSYPGFFADLERLVTGRANDGDRG